MRFIVEYTRVSDGCLLEGVKMFATKGDEKADDPSILEMAQVTAGGDGVRVTRVYEDDGTIVLGEKKKAA